MKRSILALTLFIAILVNLTVAKADPAPLDPVRVGAFFDGAVAEVMRNQHVAGATVAVVDRSGVVLTRGYGMARLDPYQTADDSTLFRVGSISKTVLWIAVMQLVEQHKITLDDPINDHLPPELRIPDEGFKEPIRIRHLMTHSAGFEDGVFGDFFTFDPNRLVPLDDYLRTHRVHRVREAGTLSVYSNYGAALAGALVAHVSGQPWPDYAEQHILRPLGMETATYREPYPDNIGKARGLPAPMPPAIAAKVTAGFSRWAYAFRQHPFEYVGNVMPAGAMSASAKDMAAYMRALLDPALMEKAGVLKAATALEMRKALFANTPELGAWRHGFGDLTYDGNRPGFGHDGALTFQRSTMEIFPDDGVAFFISINTPTGSSILYDLPATFLAQFVGPGAPAPVRAANAMQEAAKVVGVYRPLRLPYYRTERAIMRYGAGFPVIALPNGDILAGKPAFRFTPIGGGVFVSNEHHVKMAFHKVNGTMLYFDAGSAGPAERIGYFQQFAWMRLIYEIAGLAAVIAIIADAWRMIARRKRSETSSLALDALCLGWLAVGFIFYQAVKPWLDDGYTINFTYPGTLFPIACWGLAAMAFVTLLMIVFIAGPLGSHRWHWTRRAHHAATLAIFVALGVTLYTWDLLGYSGW
ncbi:MAG TPA: serine hydrolase domain-containing protein [Magnetospirillaceae bacterium]|jgi:CubicO group peptidase (beta-lactamase class C family)